MQDPTAAGAAFQATAVRFLAEERHRLRCPRCNSTNTKFCYYNNYNLSQPRHFCRDCRRYWTRGGALRNVPVGGGTRKVPKRHAATAAAAQPPSAASSPKRPDNDVPSTAASLRVGGDAAEPPPLTPLPDNFLRLNGEEPTCREGGAGRPDLAVRTPGSNP